MSAPSTPRFINDRVVARRAPGDLSDSTGTQSATVSQPQNRSRHDATMRRQFKACRTCRKHKLKCERTDGRRCQRCQDNGVQCVYDTIGPRHRVTTRKGDTDGIGAGRHRAQPALEPSDTRDQSFSVPTVVTGVDSCTVITRPSPQVPITTDGMADERSPLGSARGNFRTPMSEHSELTSDDLQAPISAMHKLSQNVAVYSPSELQGSESHQDGQPSFTRPGRLLGSQSQRKDLISKGIMNQRQARQLFNTFMAGASTFLPIFDPVLDSFETLRSREPFCFAVILTLASCVEGLLLKEQCMTEIKELVAESLFEYPATLGRVQGMILLVAYVEEAWFAIGHTLQMVADLQLDKLPSPEQMSDPQINTSRTCRRARVWLTLCFIEREIAIGTARAPRMPKVSSADLRWLTSQFKENPPNMRLAALVEAVQIRDDFLAVITAAENINSVGLDKLQDMKLKFEEWHQRWDALHETHGYDVLSFQRTSLYGQKRYAIIFLGSAMVGKIIGSRNVSEMISDSSGPLKRLVDFVMSTAMEHLTLILQSESYQWYLKWATNYTILSLTFTCMFALEISRYQSDSTAAEAFTLVTSISKLLAEYHDPIFHHLIEARLSQNPLAAATLATKSRGIHGTLSNFDLGLESASASRDLAVNHDTCNEMYRPELIGERDLVESNMRNDDVFCSDTLSQLLETPNWMTNPSSMLLFDVDGWQAQDTFQDNS